MTVLITLTTAGTDSGPFDLYSNLDGFVTPFETNILKTVLEAGYTTNLVPDFTQVVRVQSKEKCVNFIDIVLDNTTTTTTTTTDFPWLLLQTGDPIQQQNTNFIKIQ